MPVLNLEQLEIAYEAAFPIGHRLIACLTDELRELLEKYGIALGIPIEARLKTFESIEEKIVRKNLELSSISDMQDIVGLRMILLFKEDLPKIGSIIKDNFDVISYEDTSTRLDDTQFGYQSDHFIIKIKKAWESVPTYKGLSVLCAEVQVRTMAQHIWAAASHKLQYKQEENIPQPLRRSIYRVSALLETVDFEINRLSKERREYLKNVDDTADLALDVDIVAKILAEMWPAKNLCPAEEDYDGLVTELRHFGIVSSKQLRDFIDRHREIQLKDEADVIERFSNRPDVPKIISDRISRGFYFTQVALTRGGIRAEFGEEEASQVINCRAAARVARAKPVRRKKQDD